MTGARRHSYVEAYVIEGTVFRLDPSVMDRLDWGDDLDLPRFDAVIEAVERLPADERAVIEHLFWGCQSKADCARELGIARDTVYQRMKRALDRLRKELS